MSIIIADLNALAELYNAIYTYVVDQSRIAELTVEDPAEAFEDLRDKNDLKMLLNNRSFMTEGFGPSKPGTGRGKLGPPTERGWAEKWRRDLKIAGVRSFVVLSTMMRSDLMVENSDNSRGWSKCSF